jgi:hypothetical protein
MTIKLNDDIRTRHLEAFEKAYNDMDVAGLNSTKAAILRGAAEGGWFGDTLTAEQVGDLKPADMRHWADAVIALYNRINTPTDPN